MNLHIKTEETIKLEHEIWKATINQGTFGVLECTLGWFGKERVDYITYNTKGEFRCYEIKISKSDFHSKAHNSFVGNFNYYVMPKVLYDEVKDEIASDIGIWIDGNKCIKKAKRQDLKIDEQILKDSIIRSLCREVNKSMKSQDVELITKKDRDINRLKKDCKNYKDKYHQLYQAINEKYGREELRKLL